MTTFNPDNYVGQLLDTPPDFTEPEESLSDNYVGQLLDTPQIFKNLHFLKRNFQVNYKPNSVREKQSKNCYRKLDHRYI